MWEIKFHEEARSLDGPNQVLIYATGSGWNDFGYTLRVNVRVLVNGLLTDIPARLLPFVEDTPQPSVTEWIKYLRSANTDETKWKTPNKIFPNYSLVFASQQSYSDLAGKIPRADFDSLLTSIQEINANLHAGNLSSSTYAKIIETQQFKVAVLRDLGPYKAFRFGYKSAFRRQPLVEAKIPFSFSTKLQGFQNKHIIGFPYHEIEFIPDRIHCLIGVNGVGKTRYLNNLVLGIAAKLNSDLPEEQRSELYDINDKTTSASNLGIDESDWMQLPSYSRIIVYSSDPGNIFPRTTNLAGPLDYQYFDIGLDSSETLPRLLVDIIRNEADLIGTESRFILLKKILQKVIPSAQLLVPILAEATSTSYIIDEAGNQWAGINAIRGGEMRLLEILGDIDFSRDLAFRADENLAVPLSSGQKMYFRFATHFLTSANQGTIVLIDEPETHLHPNLVTEFMNLLYMVLKATSSVALIATHSAYVVREVPSHCAHVIKTDNSKNVSVERVYMNTLGASVTALSNSVFGDSLITSFHSKIASEIADSSLNLNEIVDRYNGFLSMDMLVKIRELMKHQGE
ncbi:AAA domain-containing protein, putative AbiEii toxin, Type IV TA system [Pseudomonas sp. B10]|uniref:AAA family ATPase n=1 Tax=Pseudomonas sp. B10 TaxID=118613 RepID=UPI000953829C|nr:AAA family ATPase [Pseudomonas sp. B10]SIR02294.1 AAA domain-containing protein, putative AbiEii toxin, Type IV TA system [Pseudomonas sp. B10]